MLCSKCGKEIPAVEGALYCPQCGVQQIMDRPDAKAKRMVPVTMGIVFVLVFAMVCVLIAAIAIPQFYARKTKMNDAAALSDLRNAQILCEEYFDAYKQYPESLEKLKDGQTFRRSANVAVTYTQGADTKSYAITSTHAEGSKMYKAVSDSRRILYRLKKDPDNAYRE